MKSSNFSAIFYGHRRSWRRAVPGLAWQIKALLNGSSEACGLILEISTIRETRGHFGKEWSWQW